MRRLPSEVLTLPVPQAVICRNKVKVKVEGLGWYSSITWLKKKKKKKSLLKVSMAKGNEARWFPPGSPS